MTVNKNITATMALGRPEQNMFNIIIQHDRDLATTLTISETDLQTLSDTLNIFLNTEEGKEIEHLRDENKLLKKKLDQITAFLQGQGV
jgi:hypothetical protein